MKKLITKAEAIKLGWVIAQHEGGCFYAVNHQTNKLYRALTIKTLRLKITNTL